MDTFDTFRAIRSTMLFHQWQTGISLAQTGAAPSYCSSTLEVQVKQRKARHGSSLSQPGVCMWQWHRGIQSAMGRLSEKLMHTGIGKHA